MYNAKNIVGDFFEERVMKIFDLIRTDPNQTGILPDLASRDGSFYVEVKSSAYYNGGVINERQLLGFDEMVNARRFYAFVYHSIRNMEKNYPTGEELRDALDLRSIYMFPFSITMAHFNKSHKRTPPNHDCFVQLNESFAGSIFNHDAGAWEHLELENKEYVPSKPHEKVHILTREGNLEKEILESFHPEFV